MIFAQQDDIGAFELADQIVARRSAILSQIGQGGVFDASLRMTDRRPDRQPKAQRAERRAKPAAIQPRRPLVQPSHLIALPLESIFVGSDHTGEVFFQPINLCGGRP
ncbi:hypothetical protein GCM10009081_00830 [Brevundimonas nasdae]